MSNPEREELLSAYLDGEVTADERVRVERWLAESSELRQLHDELLAMRAEIQAMPRQKLKGDLGAAVMRRTNPAPAPQSAGVDSAIVPSTLAKWWERGSGARRLVWPALAAAAALVILVFDANQRSADQQVAQAPPSRAEAPAAAPESSFAESDKYASGGKDAKIGATASPDSASAVDAGRSNDAAAPRESYFAKEKLEGDAAPPRLGMPLENRAVEMKGGRDVLGTEERSLGAAAKPMPQSPIPSAPMPPIAVPQAAARAMVPAGPKTDAPPTIICPVSPAYLRGADFEKLLASNKIEWQRLPVTPEQQVQIEAERRQQKVPAMQSLGVAPLQSLYYLRASGEQVNQVLSQVPQASNLLEGNVTQLPRMTAPQQKRVDEAGQGVQVLLVAPSEANASPVAKPAQ